MAKRYDLPFEIIVKAVTPAMEHRVETSTFEREGWKAWGSLSHFRIAVPSPAPNLEHTGKHWVEAEVEAGTVSGRALGYDHFKQEYVFALQLSGRKSLYGKIKGRAYGEFSKQQLSTLVKRIPAHITLEKGNPAYFCYGDCTGLIPKNAVNPRFDIQISDPGLAAQWKFNASTNDPNNDQPGNVLWISANVIGAPEIINLQPAHGAVVNDARVRFSGKFRIADGAAPIETKSFMLIIDEGLENEIVLKGKNSESFGELRLDGSGFEFSPYFALVNRSYTLRVSVADNNNMLAQSQSVFQVKSARENRRIADLPTTAISDIGVAHSKKLQEIGVHTVAELRDSEPVQLSTRTGIALRIIAAACEKARIACTEVHFKHAGTESLRNHNLGSLVAMLPAELQKAGRTTDPKLLKHIRSQLGMLYMCLDTAVVDKIRLSDLLWNE